jgi:agmatinase
LGGAHAGYNAPTMNTKISPCAPVRAFLDWPVVTDPDGWNTDVALLGIQHSEPYARDPQPNDQAKAPDAIRARSPQISYRPDRWDFDFDNTFAGAIPVRCTDCGNFAWTEGSYDDFAASITGHVRRLWKQDTQVFVFGGDHGVTIPVLDALDALGEPVHIVHIDAHLDWREDIEGVRRGYSSPMRWASRSPFVSGMTQLGMRQTGSAARAEVEAARRYGSRIFAAREIIRDGWSAALATIPAGVPLYISIDADGIDPTEMPGVMAPSPGGFLYREVAPVLQQIAEQHRVVGMDVVEVAPSYDSPNGITCIMAGRFVVNTLAGSWGPRGSMRRHRGQHG